MVSYFWASLCVSLPQSTLSVQKNRLKFKSFSWVATGPLSVWQYGITTIWSAAFVASLQSLRLRRDTQTTSWSSRMWRWQTSDAIKMRAIKQWLGVWLRVCLFHTAVTSLPLSLSLCSLPGPSVQSQMKFTWMTSGWRWRARPSSKPLSPLTSLSRGWTLPSSLPSLLLWWGVPLSSTQRRTRSCHTNSLLQVHAAYNSC